MGIIKVPLGMGVLGNPGIVVQMYYVAGLGAAVRGIVGLPIASTAPQAFGSTVSVFVSSVPPEDFLSSFALLALFALMLLKNFFANIVLMYYIAIQEQLVKSWGRRTGSVKGVKPCPHQNQHRGRTPHYRKDL